MRFLSAIAVVVLVVAPLAAAKAPAWTGGDEPISRPEMLREIAEKMDRVQKFLEAEKLAGLLLTRVNNFAWITAGIADNHIVITSEFGAASLLILRDGRKFVIASNSEIPRLMSEDLKGLGYEPRVFPWFEGRLPETVKELAGAGVVGTDMPVADFRVVSGEIERLRFQLTDAEIKKYRWLGRQATEAVIATIKKTKPGMSERQMEAITSNELMMRGIRPTVLLIGVDDRLYNFRHATPSDAKLQDYGMVNICARRWGLVVALTRFVHFGPIPEDLRKRLNAAANVNARFLAHSRPGTKAGDILEMAKRWYAENGFEGEWQKHHQGGAIGYGERDWVALPASEQVVHDRQAFAWNPTVMGAKVEDTVIVLGDRIENITATAGWPTIPVKVGQETYAAPDILVVPRRSGANQKGKGEAR